MESGIKYVKVIEDGQIEEGEGKVVFAGIKRVALFYLDGEYHCIQNHCPHAGGHLGLGEVRGELVMCPRHSWGFNIKSGDCVTNARYCVTVYPTKVEDDAVWVGLNESDSSII